MKWCWTLGSTRTLFNYVCGGENIAYSFLDIVSDSSFRLMLRYVCGDENIAHCSQLLENSLRFDSF